MAASSTDLIRKKFGRSSRIFETFFDFQTERKIRQIESPFTALVEMTLPTSQRVESPSSQGDSITTETDSSSVNWSVLEAAVSLIYKDYWRPKEAGAETCTKQKEVRLKIEKELRSVHFKDPKTREGHGGQFRELAGLFGEFASLARANQRAKGNPTEIKSQSTSEMKPKSDQ
ncbi:hypothetical protein V6N11_056269 [Hibiscus sabdariffa]|uniref:Uncharacterized protein n=1 Tax=Hibiscus sabdariffa TaxID=183260 RepID=A0ABR2T3Y2_9ROSI